MPEPTKKGLLRGSPEKYGTSYQDHLLEQYKLYVGMAGHISERRTSANNFLLTVNTFLLSFYGIGVSVFLGDDLHFWKVLIPLAGILVCVTWWALIRSYRQLNTAKFKVIHEIEEHLPAALFDREWDYAGRGEKNKDYLQLTRVESIIPWIFAILYFFLAGSHIWRAFR